MSDSTMQTVQMHDYIQRWQAGDNAAANNLCLAIGARLENLARRMLKTYPNVRAWAETGDVVSGAVWRLLNTLRNLRPATIRDFYNLAALHIRRELIDLARRYAGRCRPGSAPLPDDSMNTPAAPETICGDDLDLWTSFHEQVESLPVEEREVFSLTFYHGWQQQQIADLLGFEKKTVRRRWQNAVMQLSKLLGGELPSI